VPRGRPPRPHRPPRRAGPGPGFSAAAAPGRGAPPRRRATTGISPDAAGGQPPSCRRAGRRGPRGRRPTRGGPTRAPPGARAPGRPATGPGPLGRPRRGPGRPARAARGAGSTPPRSVGLRRAHSGRTPWPARAPGRARAAGWPNRPRQFPSAGPLRARGGDGGRGGGEVRVFVLYVSSRRVQGTPDRPASPGAGRRARFSHATGTHVGRCGGGGRGRVGGRQPGPFEARFRSPPSRSPAWRPSRRGGTRGRRASRGPCPSARPPSAA